MILLDTDTLSIIQIGRGTIFDRLSARLSNEALRGTPIHACVVSIEEQMRGWLAYVSRSRDVESLILGYQRLHALTLDLASRPMLSFDPAAASVFDDLQRRRVRIGTLDLRIAAIALAHDALLISRNVRDFRRVPGLRVEDWTH